MERRLVSLLVRKTIFPRAASNYVVDGAISSTKKFLYLINGFSGQVEGANTINVFLGKFCPLVRFALRGVVAFFCIHVAGVVQSCPKKQVVRIHAGRVVALVADNDSSRDFSNVQFVGKAVCSIFLSLINNLAVAATNRATPAPNPTGFCLFHKKAEPLQWSKSIPLFPMRVFCHG